MPKKGVPLLLLSLLSAACGPSVNPELKARVDAWRAALKPNEKVYVAAGTERPAFESGQWAQYIQFDDEGNPAQVTYKIIGREGEAFWLESESLTYYEHSVAKLLIAVPSWQDPSGWKVERMIVQKMGEPPQEIPPFMVQLASRPFLDTFTLKTRAGPPETVTVPAGTFQGAVPFENELSTPFGTFRSKTWVHGKIPVTGYVKNVSEDGTFRSELIAFGETGAESAIVGEPTLAL